MLIESMICSNLKFFQRHDRAWLPITIRLLLEEIQCHRDGAVKIPSKKKEEVLGISDMN